ncbi:MAG: TlpA disulfide reductase family protein [Pseudomonadota bacterium]
MFLKIKLLTAIALVFFVPSLATYAQDDLVGQQAPSWTLTDLSGEVRHFPEDFEGKATVILFWATWCPYCAAVMPYLEEIRTEYEDQGVQVLALNFKEDGDPKAHIADKGFGFQVFLEADEVARDWGIRFSPGLLVVDASGKVTYQRRSTDSAPGRAIAEYWAGQVRSSLNESIQGS